MMKRIVIMLMLILAAIPCIAIAAEVKNLKVELSGDDRVATYDLVGGAGEQEAEVTVAITVGKERRTSDKLSLTGDFGKGVKIGNSKKIVWNAKKDLPAAFGGEQSWDVKVADSQSAEDYFNNGLKSINAGIWKDAIASFTKVIELKPDLAMAYYNRGIAYDNLGNYQQAIDEYSKAVELKPDNAVAYNSRGGAYLNSGNYQQAINDFTKAVELKPDYAEGYYNLGIAYKKYQQATGSPGGKK